jgi:ribosomal protein S18 acetylase RimI-like enzyme
MTGAGDLEIRDAADREAETVHSILLAAFEEYLGWLDPPSGAHGETLESVERKMAAGGAALAFLAGTPAGCVFFALQERRLYLYRLAVLPEFRRRGLGRALIEFVEARARALGLARVRLGVRLALDAQRAYYERLGYRTVEYRCHDGYRLPTYVFMEKVLQGS